VDSDQQLFTTPSLKQTETAKMSKPSVRTEWSDGLDRGAVNENGRYGNSMTESGL